MKVKLYFATLFIVACLAAFLPHATTYSYPAYYPQGRIEMFVQNVSSGTGFKDYLTAAPGDILKYVIIVTNEADRDAGRRNSMYNVSISDELPDGLEEMGTGESENTKNNRIVRGGDWVSKEYRARVTSEQHMDLIHNDACFEAESLTGEFPQHGCNEARVTVLTYEQAGSEGEAASDSEQRVTEQAEPQVLGDRTDDGLEGRSELPGTGTASIWTVFTTVSLLGYLYFQYKHNRN